MTTSSANRKRRGRRRAARTLTAMRLTMQTLTLTFEQIATRAGFRAGADGKLNIPASQASADELARAASSFLQEWKPGDPPCEVTLTGAGPVWGYLCVAHALHGRCARLIYAAPNATVTVWSHGV
jgi:hypothetical protein